MEELQNFICILLICQYTYTLCTHIFNQHSPVVVKWTVCATSALACDFVVTILCGERAYMPVSTYGASNCQWMQKTEIVVFYL